MNFQFSISHFQKVTAWLIGLGVLATPLSASAAILRDLKSGMRGSDVRELQVFLNRDLDTQVASVGAGSSGMETDYFGPATKNAVIRFQEKYKNEVLSPAGLSQGTGFVGPLTRGKISSLSGTVNLPPQVPSPLPAVPYVASTTLPKQSAIIQPSYDYEGFTKAIQEVGASQGYSKEALEQIAAVVAEEAKKQEYGKNFVPSLEASGVPIKSAPAAKSNLLSRLGINSFFSRISAELFPQKAYALAGMPFGAMVLFPLFCTCSGNWLIFNRPYGPTYVVLLSYYMGTQAYMGYNIPFTLFMVGEYTPGAGQCMMYAGLACISIPSQGLIGPITGSSPI